MSQRKLIQIACVLFALGTCLCITPSSSAARATQASSCGGWSIVKSPNPQSTNILTAISALSASDVWAVGYDIFYPNLSVIEHWNGTKWSLVSSPNPGVYGNGLSGVSAASASDVWAVGNSTILHWNGTIWSIVQANVPGSLVGVSVISANDIWAVGSGVNGTLTEHWNGTVWHVVKSPNVKGYSSYLSAVAVVNSSDVWAVGNYDNNDIFYRTLIEHYC